MMKVQPLSLESLLEPISRSEDGHSARQGQLLATVEIKGDADPAGALERRISQDRLVERWYDIVDILEKPSVRDEFLNELFHHTRRLV